MSQDPNDVPGYGRPGGVDDPVPDREYGDDPPEHRPPELPDDPAGDVADADLLTERQAQAYIMRDIVGTTRKDAADRMDVTPNVVDKHLRVARDKVGAARATIDALDDLQAITDDLMTLDDGDD